MIQCDRDDRPPPTRAPIGSRPPASTVDPLEVIDDDPSRVQFASTRISFPPGAVLFFDIPTRKAGWIEPSWWSAPDTPERQHRFGRRHAVAGIDRSMVAPTPAFREARVDDEFLFQRHG